MRKKQTTNKSNGVNKQNEEAQKKLEAHREKVRQENKERIDFAKDTFFPLLKEINRDVGFTKKMLDTINVAIQQSFQNRILTTKVSELGIDKMINDNFEDKEIFLKVIDSVKECTVARAQNYLGDFKEVVDGFATKELDKRNINEVNLESILNEKVDETKVFLK